MKTTSNLKKTSNMKKISNIKPNILNRTKHTKPKQQRKSTKIKFISHVVKSKLRQSIKVNKNLIKSRQVEAFSELGTAKPQFFLSSFTHLINGFYFSTIWLLGNIPHLCMNWVSKLFFSSRSTQKQSTSCQMQNIFMLSNLIINDLIYFQIHFHRSCCTLSICPKYLKDIQPYFGQKRFSTY